MASRSNALRLTQALLLERGPSWTGSVRTSDSVSGHSHHLGVESPCANISLKLLASVSLLKGQGMLMESQRAGSSKLVKFADDINSRAKSELL